MGRIFTHNCGFRVFCGKATESGASMVALDSTLATTVDNTYPGAGIVQSAGNPTFARFYFSKFEDLAKYYEERGLDNLGYDPNSKQVEEVLEDLNGEEEISSSHETVNIDFENEHKSIEKRDDQNWEEI